jgi:hemerythrin-like domain-containing protein
MKRDLGFWGLTSDHHHALVLARRARLASEGTGPVSPEAAWREVVDDWRASIAAHFDAEERLLLPALGRVGESALVARTLAEHAGLRRVIGEPPEDRREALERFAELLDAHVRFEERELFEIAQARLTPGELDAIAAGTGRGGTGVAAKE